MAKSLKLQEGLLNGDDDANIALVELLYQDFQIANEFGYVGRLEEAFDIFHREKMNFLEKQNNISKEVSYETINDSANDLLSDLMITANSDNSENHI